MEVLQLLAVPFLACLCLILIHTYFGIHVLERGIIFVDLSLAQFIGLGIACALYFNHEAPDQYIWSTAFAVIGAILLSFSRCISRFVNIEAFIGVLYIFGLSASILILDRTPHGLEELKSLFNGNILWVSGRDVWCAALLYTVIGIFHLIFRKRFFALSYGNAQSPGWEFIFFLTFSLVLVSSVKLAGILQVFAFLVIPALIGRLFGGSPGRVLVGGWAIGLGASIFGLTCSYVFDLPTAPLIVSSLCLVFFSMLTVTMLRKRRFPAKL
ncbi:MAG TPA: metal ABC transporter permease [Syntrophorhabdaceae bacterium]|jgi:zinc/manganese transport system permease protein